MGQEELQKLSDAELSERMAFEMGWIQSDGRWYADGERRELNLATDANAIREVEAEIERRGLPKEYGRSLWAVVGAADFVFESDRLWIFARASPRARCIAALMAVQNQEQP